MTLLAPPHPPESADVDELVRPADTLLESPGAETPAGPAQHEIATEAYTRYLLRGCQDGHAVDDWLQAERTLRDKYSVSPRD